MIHWDDSDTICALSTPAGRGGIAIVRVSGTQASSIVQKFCSSFPSHPETHRVYYGFLKTKNGDAVDEVLMTYFAAGRSFTSQETVEISCHGNPLIVDRILSELIDLGARLARPGEFTFRAFMNGRLDLVQAESVLNLIESRSPAMQRSALRQLQGELSEVLAKIKQNIIYLLAHIEAGIDFSTENLEVISSDEVERRLTSSLDYLKRLTDSYRAGRIAKDGVRVVLLGKPNAGKSSLLNYLLHEERSIVSPLPGTTRDFIESRWMVSGHEITVVDTAGLREAKDEIERIGVERSQAQAKQADIVFYLADKAFLSLADVEEFKLSRGTSYGVFAISKSDLEPSLNFSEVIKALKEMNIPVLEVSPKMEVGREELLGILKTYLHEIQPPNAEYVVLNARHFEGVTAAKSAVEAALDKHHGQIGSEFLSLDLQEALSHVQEVLGESADEAVIDKIFKEFCLGK